jgi:flagellar biosynthetic protein FliR
MIDALAGVDVLGEASRFFLVLLRTGGLVVFCPILGSEILPVRVRVGIALVLAVVALPVVPPVLSPRLDVVSLFVAAVRESAVGLGLGMTARVLFAGIEGAAGLVAGQSGFSLASMVDPLSGESSASTVLFQNLLAVALFLAADLHHVFVRGLYDSYRWLPQAFALPSAAGLDRSVSLLGTHVFAIAAQLAAPALVVTFAVDLVLVLVGRALPQVQILNVGYPAKMAAGIVALAVLVPATGATIGWMGRTLATDGARVVAAFAGR